MRCPFCNYEDTRVIDSRPSEGKKRRRRELVAVGGGAVQGVVQSFLPLSGADLAYGIQA